MFSINVLEAFVRIEFLDGSLVAHPNFERYLDESTSDGAVPLKFDCVADAAEPTARLAVEALRRLELQAAEEAADLLPATLVATRSPQGPGVHRHRVLVIARKRRMRESSVVAVDWGQMGN